jgi:hypothetical protein
MDPLAAENDSVAGGTGPEKQQPTVLNGRVLGRVRKGRPDAQGHDTAWARFAAHEEGRDDAHIYSTTFHRGSARLAMALLENAHITVEGYPHPANDPAGKRLDTLSVFRLLHRPHNTAAPDEHSSPT